MPAIWAARSGQLYMVCPGVFLLLRAVPACSKDDFPGLASRRGCQRYSTDAAYLLRSGFEMFAGQASWLFRDNRLTWGEKWTIPVVETSPVPDSRFAAASCLTICALTGLVVSLYSWASELSSICFFSSSPAAPPPAEVLVLVLVTFTAATGWVVLTASGVVVSCADTRPAASTHNPTSRAPCTGSSVTFETQLSASLQNR